MKKWDTLDRTFVDDFKIFKLSWLKRKHPDWQKEGNFVVLDSLNWVNIIPVTEDNKIILIEQYRHGIDEITLEVPGGLVEFNEKPRLAAQRECMEETGYQGLGDAVLIGENSPNPAFLNTKCYSYLWKGCKKVALQNLDRHEDIEVLEVPAEEIKNLILNKKIQHSLVLTAFFFYFLKYEL